MVFFGENCSLLTLGLWCQDEAVKSENQSYEDVDVVGPLHANFHAGMAASVCVTVMSELGDKSFFMSAILAMHHSRTLTFLGSMLGQTIMTVIAVTLGMAASLVPEVYTKWASCICMTFFGLKMLREGFSMPIEEDGYLDDNDNIKSFDKVTDKLRMQNKERATDEESEHQLQSHKISTTNNEKDNSNARRKLSSRRSSGQGVLMQAFTLSFLGEWGDRSQIATILLASNENPYGVAAGSFVGHVVCSLMAVVGGRLLGQKFPVKTMTQAGGVVFLLCAASAIIFE